MKIESISLKNFKAFQDAKMRDIPKLCVLVGANGTGKSSLFSVFGFLKDALSGNVNTALAKLGGARGFDEVMSRNSSGFIEIELKFREKATAKSPLITYFLQIGKKGGRAYVEKEILKYRKGSKGKPWHFLDYSNGDGYAVINEVDSVKDESELKREAQQLKSNDILAVKGLAQFERFPAAMALGNLIENWHISDFHINRAHQEQDAGYAEHLSREGENLSLVIQYLYQNDRDAFDKILSILKKRVPGIIDVKADTDHEGRILLRFRDEAFSDLFLSRFISDGTIKMLAYLVLLYDSNPFPLLCVEEPENQLYPSVLGELVEEFRAYAKRGGQVFVSTHSPDFLNAVKLDEVFWLEKENGYTKIKHAKNDAQIAAYMSDGDKMGYLWKQGFFGGADPK
ncbi:MAG: AAA family ATPase [Clostridiales bacterium]|jgi:predicted ATPase|nr:AAA family ATPase [Clostridiales bacterium]